MQLGLTRLLADLLLKLLEVHALCGESEKERSHQSGVALFQLHLRQHQRNVVGSRAYEGS